CTLQIALTFLLSANNQRHEVYHPSLNRSILAVVDEKNSGTQIFALDCKALCSSVNVWLYV
ncbi:hypothetical protein ACPFRV_004172, partial [Shigella flexneri]